MTQEFSSLAFISRYLHLDLLQNKVLEHVTDRCFLLPRCVNITLIIQTINSAECPRSVSALGFAFGVCIYSYKDVTNIKTRKLFIGEQQAILKLTEDEKSIRAIAQTLAIACTSIWNVLKKKKPLMYLATDVELVDEGKHQQLMTEIVRAVKKTPKTIVSDIITSL